MASKQSYLGNPNLKGTGVSVDWTPESVEEYKKCMESPLYFIKNYVQIVNVDRGLVPFDMWDFQEDMINHFHDERFVICKMPRQTGKSTTIISYLLHFVSVQSRSQRGNTCKQGCCCQRTSVTITVGIRTPTKVSSTRCNGLE